MLSTINNPQFIILPSLFLHIPILFTSISTCTPVHWLSSYYYISSILTSELYVMAKRYNQAVEMCLDNKVNIQNHTLTCTYLHIFINTQMFFQFLLNWINYSNQNLPFLCKILFIYFLFFIFYYCKMHLKAFLVLSLSLYLRIIFSTYGYRTTTQNRFKTR